MARTSSKSGPFRSEAICSRAFSRKLTGRATEAQAAPFPALPDRPSIAVLPFENLSEEPDQEHFADGVTEDLITGLSRIKWLFVIARNSTFIYKDRRPM